MREVVRESFGVNSGFQRVKVAYKFIYAIKIGIFLTKDADFAFINLSVLKSAGETAGITGSRAPICQLEPGVWKRSL